MHWQQEGPTRLVVGALTLHIGVPQPWTTFPLIGTPEVTVGRLESHHAGDMSICNQSGSNLEQGKMQLKPNAPEKESRISNVVKVLLLCCKVFRVRGMKAK